MTFERLPTSDADLEFLSGLARDMGHIMLSYQIKGGALTPEIQVALQALARRNQLLEIALDTEEGRETSDLIAVMATKILLHGYQPTDQEIRSMAASLVSQANG